MLSSPDAQCLNPSALLSLVTGSSNSSIISPINNWLQGLCPQAPCSNGSLAQVVTNLTSGCSAELSNSGIATTSSSQLTTIVQQAYPAVRQVICLRNTTANDLCVTELLTDIQSAVGTNITSGNLIQVFTNLLVGSKIPPSIACSDCVKESYNIINQDFPALLNGSTSSAISSTCGTAFINGATPTDISESASTASAGSNASKSGAAPLFSVNSIVGVAVSTLVILSSGFAVLA